MAAERYSPEPMPMSPAVAAAPPLEYEDFLVNLERVPKIDPNRIYTEAEYLELDRISPLRLEYYNGRILHVHRDLDARAMAGASTTHNIITVNLTIALGNKLRAKGGGCRPFSQDMRVRYPNTTLYAYPDVMIACPPFEFDPNQKDTLLNPTAIFEVLSPGTEAKDRGDKFAKYRNIASLRDYVLVSQDELRVEHYARGENGDWLLRFAETLDSELALGHAALNLREIYEDVEFSAP